MSSSSVFWEIIHGVDWSEPWLLGLCGCHVVTGITILLLRHHVYLQAMVLAVLALLCFSSEKINECAALNYSLFSKEQYFDPNGFFIFTVFAGPIIFNCFLIVVCWLWKVWDMMCKVGTMKVRRRAKTASSHNSPSQKSKIDSKKYH